MSDVQTYIIGTIVVACFAIWRVTAIGIEVVRRAMPDKPRQDV